MVTSTENPWKDLAAPGSMDTVNARRVDADRPWDFFWARDVDRRCLLILRLGSDSMPDDRTPRLKGIDITFSRSDGDQTGTLIFKLLDPSHLDIFHRLCLDIMSAADHATSEKEAARAALARTWRWHHLLRGGGDDRLSPEEQKGLLGELLVLERILLPRMSVVDAVAAWRGPLGSPKDFEIGRTCIEVKARRGAAAPWIEISSEHQLDDSSVESLFLLVAEIDQAPSDSESGFTVSSVAERVRRQILAANESAIDAFESLLLATGFRWQDDYSDSNWIEGPYRIYAVTVGFPRITPELVNGGVSNVRYSVSLIECEQFRCSEDRLIEVLMENRHAH